MSDAAALGLELHGLYDQARLARELGIKRGAAEQIMRQLPKVRIEGMRKTYVAGGDVERYIKENTVRR